MNNIEVPWATMKDFVDARGVSIQWVSLDQNYWLQALDGNFGLECFLPNNNPDDPNQADFEANYKANGNQSPTHYVTTLFEKDDKTLKAASGQSDFDSVTGLATVDIAVPGMFGVDPARSIAGGSAWIVEKHANDRIITIEGVATDEIPAGVLSDSAIPAGTVLKTYHDTDLAEQNQGYRIPYYKGFMSIETIGGYGTIYAGVTLRVVAKKGGEAPYSGTLYVNVEWGKLG